MRKPSTATVLAGAALFVALTGTAVAGGQVLITGADIKNGSITGVDVKNGSITGVDVKKRSLTLQHVRGQLRGARGTRGSQGPPGVPGAQGLPGPPGPPGITTLTEVVATRALAPGEINFVIASCPTGQGAVSGGATMISADGEIFIDRRFAGSGWSVGGDNFDSSLSAELRAYVYCSTGVSAASASVYSADLAALVRKQRDAHR